MAVKVTPAGNGSWVGAPHNIIGFDMTEESTPISGGDESGAIGGGSFEVSSNRDTVLLIDDRVTISDDTLGTADLRVMSVSDNGTTATVEVDHATTLLLAERSLPPYSGTLGGWFDAAFAQCELPAPTITSDIRSRIVAYGAHIGEVWDAVKQVCAAQQIQVTYRSGIVYVEHLRRHEISLGRATDPPRHVVGGGEMARAVEIISYDNVWGSDNLVYPTDGWNEEVRVFQVASGETLEVDVQVDVSVVSIEQPSPVVWVSRAHNATSVYAIAGNDGLPIQPAQWTAEGGKLEVTINDDYKSLHLKITGAGNENLGPFQLAMAAGTSDVYSSIRLVGSGVWQRPLTEKYLTGVSDEDTAREIGETIEVPFAYGRAQVVGLGISAAQRFTGRSQTLSAQAESFPATPSELPLGSVAGSRVKQSDQYWRVRSATVSEFDQSFDAEPNTLFGDFNEAHAGKTFGDFNTSFDGYSFSEFDLMPLREN